MGHVSIACMVKEMHLYGDVLDDFQDRGLASYSARVDLSSLI